MYSNSQGMYICMSIRIIILLLHHIIITTIIYTTSKLWLKSITERFMKVRMEQIYTIYVAENLCTYYVHAT